MKRSWFCSAVACGALGVPLMGVAQEAGPPMDSGAPLTLHVSSKLVLVDVVVQDAKGQPVLGLKRNNFVLVEDKKPQALRVFEPHEATDAPHPGPPAPQLPAGTFTDYTPNPPGNTLNVILLDALNTPLTDQAYLHTQLKEYLRHAQPGTAAIFALNERLLMLQGFTTDPAVLQAALASKGTLRLSSQLEDPTGSNVQGANLSDSLASLGPEVADLVSNLQQFEAETRSFALQQRAQYTLDAMNGLARYLANFPGRKNLIWFSGSFPINLLPDPSLNNGFTTMNLDQDEFRQTVNLLAAAQVAVYPIDARGLMTPPTFSAANTGRRTASSPAQFAKELSQFNASQGAEQTTMRQMANDTGGIAFVGSNDFQKAIEQVATLGANYYTLAYSPDVSADRRDYHSLRVVLQGVPGAESYTLSYRRGYYAETPVSSTAASAGSHGATAAFDRVVMSHGSPAPQDILFDVEANVVAGSADAAAEAGTEVEPAVQSRGGFHKVQVKFVSLPSGITFTPLPGGLHAASIGFQAYVYAADGSLLSRAGRTLNLKLPAADYQKVMQTGVGMELTVSAPAAGSAFVRLAVHDVPSNRYGAVELPMRAIPVR